ncbi:MAG: hypothetical protein M1816_002974 [Peltula sp. TS41687]|nr:MAG: hypothetical protein M1816_002974 [Peltula sp. TS41687]
MSLSSVVVTGGAGFVGTATVQALFAKHPGCRIIVLDLRIPSPVDRLPDIEYYEVDVTSASAVSAIMQELRPEVVIHTAGVVPPVPQRYSRKQEARVFRINVEGTRNVLAASRESGVKAFVLTSSCTVVVDALEYELPNVDETLPTFRHSLVYGESKAEAERIVLAASDDMLPTCAIRPSILFGPGDPICIPTIHSCIAKCETPFVIGSGTNLCDFTYVDNIADAHILAAENLMSSKTAAGEAFFISGGEPLPFRAFCEAVWAEFGHVPPFVVRIPESVAWCAGVAAECISWLTGTSVALSRGSVYDAFRTRYASILKARRILGYTPRIGMVEGLHVSCQAYKRQLESALERKSFSSEKKKSSSFKPLEMMAGLKFPTLPISLLGGAPIQQKAI